MSVIVFMTLANPRGAKASGTLFAIPTYLHIVGLTLLVGVGLFVCSPATWHRCPSTRPI